MSSLEIIYKEISCVDAYNDLVQKLNRTLGMGANYYRLTVTSKKPNKRTLLLAQQQLELLFIQFPNPFELLAKYFDVLD